jgi:hypothetical protein
LLATALAAEAGCSDRLLEEMQHAIDVLERQTGSSR